MIEKVKGILESNYFSLHITDPSGFKIANKKYIGHLSREICHLFPKSADNPDGYEPKPKKGLSIPSFTAGDNWGKIEAEPENGRLLTEDEILNIIKTRYPLVLNQLDIGLHILIAKAQRDLTASTKESEFTKRIINFEANQNTIINSLSDGKDAECQARVERIFGEIESHIVFDNITTDDIILADWWQSLKKQEGIKDGK